MKRMFCVAWAAMSVAGFALADGGTSETVERAISLNTFAVSKTVSPQKLSIIAVPWTSYFTNFSAGVSLTNLPVAKVVNSLNLTTGDQIVAYKDGHEFWVWTLYKDGPNPRWEATEVYKSDAPPKDATIHQDEIVDRGYSFWLKRKDEDDPKKPFFVYGQYATNAEAVVIAPGESKMLGNIDTLRGLALNTDLEYENGSPFAGSPVEAGDRISLSGNGPAARILYWNKKMSKWYYMNGGLVTNVVVSPGQGFWYVRSSKAPGPITVKIRAPNYSGE